MEELKEFLFMLESDGSVEIAREYARFNYVEYFTVIVIGVGIIFGIFFLLKTHFGFRYSNGLLRKDMNKKINEIAGFCKQILKVVRKFNRKKEIVSLKCSCGKSYLSKNSNTIN